MKTHRAACAIDDFVDDSKQALSMISWMAAQWEVKTHRAACAIDDFIDDSKQALSMISWMAAQRKGRKTRTQAGLRWLLSPDLIAAKFAKGFYNVEFSTRLICCTLVHF